MTIEAVLPVLGPGPVARPLRAIAVSFRRDEGVALAVGGLAVGAATGLGLFFLFGRIPPWMPFAVAITGYGAALQLASVSMQDVSRNHSPWATLLFATHLAALAAWPLAISLEQTLSWQLWLALPIALGAFALFLMISRGPAGVIYRSSVHISLITAIAAYQWMWLALDA